MARARDFYAGESKTDPKDAFVLADVARAHPNRLVWLRETSAARAQLELLNGYDTDLREDANRLTNRMRALLASARARTRGSVGHHRRHCSAQALPQRATAPSGRREAIGYTAPRYPPRPSTRG